MSTKRWTENCPAQKELVKRMDSGDLTSESQPKPTYDKYSVFKNYSLVTFRNHFAFVKFHLCYNFRKYLVTSF